jgi:hypothetical protein
MCIAESWKITVVSAFSSAGPKKVGGKRAWDAGIHLRLLGRTTEIAKGMSRNDA